MTINNLDEYQRKMIINVISIALLSASMIILIIPIVFFTIGHTIETSIVYRELNRYVLSWCNGPLALPVISNTSLKVSQEDQNQGVELKKANEELERNAFYYLSAMFCILAGVSFILALISGENMMGIVFKSLIGVMMFIIVEVVAIVVCFQNYYPMDINAVNTVLVDKLL